VHALSGEVEALSERYAAVLRRIAGAVQHVGVVRFDAFRDLGGLLSFAVALLDDRGNGLVFSSIYGRSESRTYAKPCIERSSSYELSPEEREAIRLAMQSKDMGALPVEAKDKDHEERMANLRLFHDREYVTRTPEARAEAEAHITGEKPDVAERRPPRRPPEEQRQPSPPRRKVGRANHIRPVERAPEPERTPPPERGPEPELAPPTGRSLEDEVEKLLKPEAEPAGAREPGTPPGGIDTRGERGERTERQPRSERPIEKPAERVPQRKPTTPRPRGLDTPVDRLRNKEQE
jgi:hypothetical protein